MIFLLVFFNLIVYSQHPLDSERLRKLRDSYGPVNSWHVSTYNFVCFNDFAAIQEALCRVNAGDPFTGRVNNPLGDWLTQKKGSNFFEENVF